jgi:hypothetical protein
MNGFKGEPNRNGRPKGSKNLATAKIRDAFRNLVENNLEQIDKDVAELEPKERLKFIIDLSSFLLPKLRSIEAEVSTNTPENTFKITDIYKTLIEDVPEEKFNEVYNEK